MFVFLWMNFFTEQIEALEALLGRMHNRISSTEKRGSIPLVTAFIHYIYVIIILNAPMHRDEHQSVI